MTTIHNSGNAPPKFAVPSINSSDREERIQARRSRIETRQKFQNSLRNSADSGSLNGDAIALGTGEAAARQIHESRRQFTAVLFDGVESVTKIRAITEQREQQRREQLAKSEVEQKKKKEQEKQQSDKANEESLKQWDKVFKIDIPEEVLKMIQKQKISTDSVVSSKDRLIAEYQKELKNKEDEYTKALTKQAEDVGEW
jgi:hypothetical protein